MAIRNSPPPTGLPAIRPLDGGYHCSLCEKGYSAAIYTQLSDIEEEVNGLITYDRKKVKMNPLIVRSGMHGLRKR